MQKVRFSCICLTLLACIGCGGGVAHQPVSGTVTVNGEPGQNILVTFSPVEGEEGGLTATGTTDGQGNYKLATLENVGAPAGNYTVSISRITVPKKGQAGEAEMSSSSSNDAYEQQAMGTSAREYQAAEKDNSSVKIPPQYNSQSTMRETVTTGGENKIDFDLTF